MDLPQNYSIIETNKPLALAMAEKITGDSLSAEEAVLQAEPRWLLRIIGYPEKNNSAGYLSMVRDCAMEIRRKKIRRQSLFVRYSVDQEIQNQPMNQADLMSLRDCVQGLPPEQQIIIALHYLGDEALEAVSKIIDRSLATAKRLRTAALASLKACMDR